MRCSTVGIIITLALSILAAAPLADAQLPGKKIPRIGELDVAPRSVNTHRREALLQGLRERGWVEGQHFAIEYRSTEGKDALLPKLAAELVRLQSM
jgi:putative tryptophan/tyrosine transport system substrate-binding protein